MNITYDSAKDAANLAKHGISLAEAVSFEWESAIAWPDTRKDYGETRMVALGYIGLRIMALVFTDRAQNHQPTQGQQPRGATLCPNLNQTPYYPQRKRMPPSPLLQWQTLMLNPSPMPSGNKPRPWCAVAAR